MRVFSMGHIFISYSHKDSSYVHKLVDALEEEGFEVWIDDRIHYGSEWPKVVTRNLDASDGVIVVLSNNSFESDMVQNEVTRARDKKKPIFPLLLEGDNWLIVQAKQFVDVRDESIPTEKFYRRLEEITQRKDKKAEREAAEKAAQEKARLEAEEQARQKAAKEKVEREAAEKAARERAEREESERIAKEKTEREVAGKAAREKGENDARLEAEEQARQKAAKEKAEHDFTETVAFEEARRKVARRAALVKNISNSFATLKLNSSTAIYALKLTGIIGLFFLLLWLGTWFLPKFNSFLPTLTETPTKKLTAQLTSTYSPVPPTRTLIPSATLTKSHTPTKTLTPTLASTVTYTPTAPFLTYCTWQEKSYTQDFKNFQYEASCNDVICSVTQITNYKNGTYETFYRGLWSRFTVNQRLQDGEYGKCFIK
jgi:actin-related protein